MNEKSLKMVALMTVFLFAIAARIEAGSAAEDFYRGKVIRIIVGFQRAGALTRLREQWPATWASMCPEIPL